MFMMRCNCASVITAMHVNLMLLLRANNGVVSCIRQRYIVDSLSFSVRVLLYVVNILLLYVASLCFIEYVLIIGGSRQARYKF